MFTWSKNKIVSQKFRVHLLDIDIIIHRFYYKISKPKILNAQNLEKIKILKVSLSRKTQNPELHKSRMTQNLEKLSIVQYILSNIYF
jgi:hypothetical protein